MKNFRVGDEIRFDSEREGRGTGKVKSITNFILTVETNDNRTILLSDVLATVECLTVYDVTLKKEDKTSILLEKVERDDANILEKLAEKYAFNFKKEEKKLENW